MLQTDKRGGAPKRKARTKTQKLNDFNFITPLFIRGVTYWQITEQLQAQREYSVTYKMVYADVKEIVDQWHDERMELIDKQKTIELKKIDRLEAMYFEAWDRSLQLKTKDVTKRGGILVNGVMPNPDRVFQEKHTAQGNGDPRFLDGIQWCIDMRCQILGFKKLTQVEAPPMAEQARDVVFTVRGRKGAVHHSNEGIQEAEEVHELNTDKKLIQ